MEGIELGGLHHTSSITKDAVANARFYVQTLGMRLVYKGVNFDDPSMYHLAYRDDRGTHGTILTFFDEPLAAPHRPGAGEASVLALRVPGGALTYWADRLEDEGVRHAGVVERYDGRQMIAFTDPEGHRWQLVDEGQAPAMPGGEPWADSTVPPGSQVRGLDSYLLAVRSLEPTRRALVDLMGFRQKGAFEDSSGRSVAVFEVGPGGPGAEVHVVERPDLGRQHLGAGGVHHVAFKTGDDEEIRRWYKAVAAAGLISSQVVDRFYARSLYFREPGGVLFELTTTDGGPSWFSRGGDLASLGRRLVIPPELEPRRAEVGANLRPLPIEQFVGKD